MKKTVVLTVLTALVIVCVVRVQLAAQEGRGESPVEATQHVEKGTEESEQGDVPEQIDRSQVIVGENFFVASVTTPLHRRMAEALGEEFVAYASINAKSFIVQGTGLIDLQALELVALRRAMRQIAETQEHGKLRISINYGYLPPNDASMNIASFLRGSFEGMGRIAGFSDARAYGSWSNVEDYVWKPLTVDPRRDGAAEENLGTELVQVYPVRTPLSRYQLGDTDCYIRLDAPPLEEWKEEYLTTLENAVRQMELGERKKAKIQVFVPDPESNHFEMPVDPVVNVLRRTGFEEIDVFVQKDATNRKIGTFH